MEMDRLIDVSDSEKEEPRGCIAGRKSGVFGFCCILLALIAVSAGLLAVGNALDWWSVASEPGRLPALVLIVPAVLWIFFKGINFVNFGLYLAGFDYAVISGFLDFTQSVVLIAAEAVVLVLWIAFSTAKKNKALTDADTAGTDAAENGCENDGGKDAKQED